MRRTLQSIPLLLAISVILYGILYNMPGGPLAPYLQNPHITPADIARLKHNLGMDVTIVTTANTDAEAKELLKLLGMPFSS